MSSSRTISANGIEIFLLEEGEGPLVVLAMAGRNCPIRGGIKSRRLRTRVSMLLRRICEVSADRCACRYRCIQHLRYGRRYGRVGRRAWRKAGGHRRS